MAAQKLSRKKLIARSRFILFMLCAVGFGICLCALVYVQLVKGAEFRERAAQNQLHDTVITAERGIIYDANMTPLAESSAVKRVYINPKKIGDDTAVRTTIAKKLSKILSLDEEDVLEKCSQTEKTHVVLKKRVEKEAADQVLAFMQESFDTFDESGERKTKYFSNYVGMDPDVKRYYSKPFLASAVLGFTGDDDIGRGGLEMQYNSVLTGVPGRVITAQNGAVDSSSMPIEYKNVYDAKRGTSLVLTLNEYIQSYLENGLQSTYDDTQADNVLGIIMDVNTGAVLGMGSRGQGYYDLSRYDTLLSETKNEEIREIEDAEERSKALNDALYRQWRNICISDAYEPGSVFKVFTASALIEEGLAKPEETYTCVGSVQAAGSLYNCHRHTGHGTQDMKKALMNSCNPFFITRGLRLGVQGFDRYFEAFGFKEKTGIDLPEEGRSVYFNSEKMTLSNVASASFGQTFRVTPIQMITAISCIANGGKLVQPYLVAKQLDADGNIVEQTKTTVKRQVISAETSEKVRDMMEAVVREGTGKNAYVAGYRVAGKTGTSEKVGTNEYWASFACFAPANDPQVAMILVIDNPKGAHGGGAVAAPAAAGILENVLQYLNIEPQYTENELAKMAVIAKNVVGQNVQEARTTLQADGFTVRVKGDGDTVISQIPGGGQSVPQNGAIILYTTEDAKSETLEMPDLLGLTINQATAKALAAGINIKIAGNSLMSSELVSFSQSVEPGEPVGFGTTVTVHFKSNMGVVDE